MRLFYPHTFFLFICFFLGFGNNLSAQPPWAGGRSQGPGIKGRISGVVLDSISGEALEFAMLALIQAKDGKQLDGGIIDSP